MSTDGRTRRKYPQPSGGRKYIRDYDFLQYIRLVMKWAVENSGLSRPQVELLLYLYPKGTFTKQDFNLYHKTISIFQEKTFNMFVDNGWIVMWRPKKGKQNALYVVSLKTKKLCAKMHKFLTGEIEMTTDIRYNKIADKSEKRINSYYMDAIIKMNKERDKKNRDEE